MSSRMEDGVAIMMLLVMVITFGAVTLKWWWFPFVMVGLLGAIFGGAYFLGYVAEKLGLASESTYSTPPLE